eukprot:SAG11_NODE_1856_length_4162_cov_4.778981_2_plen_156_part_00
MRFDVYVVSVFDSVSRHSMYVVPCFPLCLCVFVYFCVPLRLCFYNYVLLLSFRVSMFRFFLCISLCFSVCVCACVRLSVSLFLPPSPSVHVCVRLLVCHAARQYSSPVRLLPKPSPQRQVFHDFLSFCVLAFLRLRVPVLLRLFVFLYVCMRSSS